MFKQPQKHLVKKYLLANVFPKYYTDIVQQFYIWSITLQEFNEIFYLHIFKYIYSISRYLSVQYLNKLCI